MTRAIIIDDDYARPTRADIQEYLEPLRSFITDNISTKAWFDEQFGLSGDHTNGDYFDVLLSDPLQLAKFWRIRDECPLGVGLAQTVFPNLAKEIDQLHSPLKSIEAVLNGRSWSVERHSYLPQKLSTTNGQIVLIVLDYILDKDNLEKAIEKSEQFVSHFLQEATQTNDFQCPFIMLISALPSQAKQDAEQFRRNAGVDGSYFRFWAKRTDGIMDDFEQSVSTFLRQQPELERYRRMHERLKQVSTVALKNMVESIGRLELQDLATLHAGQLVEERETLANYLAWLYGQAFTTQVVNDIDLAAKCAKLPGTSFEVLLGHLPATGNIPEMFCSFSLSRPGSAEIYKESRHERELRFGDLFEELSKTPDATPVRYMLVISQTCDLIQCKITNQQVLCVEGNGRHIGSTEVELLKATIKQMDARGDILIRDAKQYIEIEWEEKNLRTIDSGSLAHETGYTYLGRLNEIYALEAQRRSLEALSRVGVPIQPGYSVFFGSVLLRVFNSSAELQQLAATFDPKAAVAVLRNEKAPSVKHRLLMSDGLRKWLVDALEKLTANALLPDTLKSPLNELVEEIRSDPDWNLMVKDDPKGARFFRVKQVLDKKTGTLKPTPADLPAATLLILRDVFKPLDNSNARVEIEFQKI